MEAAGALLAQVAAHINPNADTDSNMQSGFGIHPGTSEENAGGDNSYISFGQIPNKSNNNEIDQYQMPEEMTPMSNNGTNLIGQKRKMMQEEYNFEPENGNGNLSNNGTVTTEPENPVPEKKARPTELMLESAERRGEDCLHYTASPEGYVQSPFTPREKPARTWPFKLDDFQRIACECLDKNESVMVAAHTSAGKTVVAEYAVALAFEKNSRCIYTAPIKALSNQKYRELKEEFNDVGLMTGDVNIAPHSSCVVMTTEILRNMLLRGHEMLREVTWVIFDEVHYMRDKDRGIVWEESIILIPKSIKCVYLSATLANHNEFADWVCHLKKEPCHCITTNFRPTPLCHYAFPPGGSGIFLLKDEAGNFKSDNFKQALELSKQSQDDSSGGPSDLARLIVMAKERDWLPIIVFTFARRECEGNAMSVSTIDLTDESEKELVEEVFMSAIEGLLEEDRSLPQIKTLLPLLKRGIGVHHSGLLPILKEVVEILFQECLVKVLFATETFAMGVNMPAKSVVFMNMQKFDGVGFRYLTSGEYIQMSGRAGRRNTDKRGIVILMLDSEMDEKICRDMMVDLPDPLDSKFRLSYNMILNLMRAESDNDPEYVIKMSMNQFQYERNLPKVVADLEQMKLKIGDVGMNDESDIYNFLHMNDLVEELRSEMQDIAMRPSVLLPYLQPGRVVYIKDRKGDANGDFGWGVVVNYLRKYSPDGYEIHVLLPISEMKPFGMLAVPLPVSKENLAKLEANYKQHGVCQNHGQERIASFEIVRIMADMIDVISTCRLYMPRNLSDPRIRQRVYEVGLKAKDSFSSGFEAVSALDMGLNKSNLLESKEESDRCIKISERIKSLKSRILISPVNKLPVAKKRSFVEIFKKRKAIQVEIDELKSKEKQSHLIQYRQELKNRIRVLRRLGHITPDGVMQEKGKIAAEVEGVDELVMTELIFEGWFLELDVSVVMAIITCFFQMSKPKEEPQLSPKLGKAFRRLKSAAMLVCGVQIECKIDIKEDEYLDQFKPNLMMLTDAWIRGKSFPEICKLSDEFEGSIVRNLRRLEELVRQLIEAAKAIGNKELEDKFEEGSRLLKRGIVFANSLYV